MAKANRVIEYRIAKWFKTTKTLEQYLREAWAVLPTTHDRTVDYGDRLCMGSASTDFGKDGFAIQCVFYVDKQGVGTIPMVAQPIAVLGESKPQADENFATGDLFAVVCGNDLAVVNAGRNATRIRTFLHLLFDKAGLGGDSTMFDIHRRADIDKLKMIERLGVKAIDLETAISEASLSRIKELSTRPSFLAGAMATILTAVTSIVAKDKDTVSLLEAKKGLVSLSIRVPKGDLEEAQHGLASLAENIVGELAENLIGEEDEGGFVIHLNGNHKISSNEIAVRKSVRIDKHANTLNAESAWQHLRDMIREQR